MFLRQAFLLLCTTASVLSVLRRTKYGCEGTLVHLQCEEGQYISPVRANFGRFNAGICNPEGNKIWSTRCIQPTTLRQVNALCQGKSSCSIDVTSSVFGDPCPGTYKYIEVHYTCQAQQNLPQRENNLPPWLLKMSATTSRPRPSTSAPPPSTTTTTSTPPAVMDTLFESLVDGLEIEQVEEVSEEDLGLELDRYEEVFINLPLEEPEIQTVVAAEENRVVLIATLIALISCSFIIFVAALLYTRIKSRGRKEERNHVFVSSVEAKFQDYTGQQCYDYDSVSSGSSTVSSLYTTLPNTLGGSIYTTLPNGDRAIVIPLNNQLANVLPHQFAGYNPQQSGGYLPQQQPQGHYLQNLQSLLYPAEEGKKAEVSQENIYIDIDSQKNAFRY